MLPLSRVSPVAVLIIFAVYTESWFEIFCQLSKTQNTLCGIRADFPFVGMRFLLFFQEQGTPFLHMGRLGGFTGFSAAKRRTFTRPSHMDNGKSARRIMGTVGNDAAPVCFMGQ
jgi:hypothetical protein